MKIKLDKYLQNQGEHLDVEEPDEPVLWEGIRKELLNQQKTKEFNFWKVAAIFLAFFTISYVLFNELNREKEFTLSEISEALGKREKDYQQLILQKMQVNDIRQLSTNTDHEIIPILFNELDELDVIYKDAMNDLEQNGYLERIVDIIFDTYEKRIRILEQILMESQKIEKYENDTDKIIL